MPYVWADPEVAISNETRTIYHAYKNDYMDSRLEYWFSMDGASETEFDIRETKVWSESQDAPDPVIAALRKVLESEEYLQLGGEEA